MYCLFKQFQKFIDIDLIWLKNFVAFSKIWYDLLEMNNFQNFLIKM